MALIKARKKKVSATQEARDAAAYAGSAVGKLNEATQDALLAVAATVAPVFEEARERLVPMIDDARDRVTPAIGDAKDRLSPVLGDAKDRLTPVLEDAKDRLAPVLEDAKDRLTPVLDDARDRIGDARDKLGPAAAAAVVAGRTKGQQAAAKLGIVEQPKPSHKVRNILIALGLGAAAAVAYKVFTGKDADPAWTATRDSASASGTTTPDASFVNPMPAGGPEPTNGSGSVDGSETAPTAPFASEETVESPVPTTPDEPLEKKDV